MKSPTVILSYCLLAALFYLFPNAIEASPDLTPYPPVEISDLTGKNMSQLLIAQLKTDQLINTETQHVKIEFEFHDIFVNERILPYELLAKYQKIFTDYGIQAGPQRQIHLYTNGDVLIGDFGQYGELIKEMPVEELSEI